VKIAPLLNSAFKAIIVAPAYRLNAFGFISSQELELEAQENGEPLGNQGFWDQRLALEWVAENIAAFGGNPEEVTVGGYSAGSHSTFQQLAHELYFVPDHKAIIKRAIMWSNSPGGKDLVQCKYEHGLIIASPTKDDRTTPSPVRRAPHDSRHPALSATSRETQTPTSSSTCRYR
jgi:carboxylesterase type B